MDNEEDYKKKPRNFGRNAPAEKPKDLKTAVKKLVHYLNKLLPLVIVALVLSCFSSVLSIIGPNRLSDLTNEITNGHNKFYSIVPSYYLSCKCAIWLFTRHNNGNSRK